MFVKAWKKIVRIQRNFFWRGVKGGSKFFWVRWFDVCKHKKMHGIGVIDLWMVNQTLFAKWRWRLLTGSYSLWVNIIFVQYGACFSLLCAGVDIWVDTLFPLGGRK